MKNTNCLKWVCGLGVVLGLVSCDLDMPKETKSSFETMTVKKSDIELPYKFSAKMKGQGTGSCTSQSAGSSGSGELCQTGVRVEQESV